MKPNHMFFHDLIKGHLEPNWVDIENYYYKFLLKLYNVADKHKQSLSYSIDPDVKKLNDCLDKIKEQLIEYLLTLNISKTNDGILSHLYKEITETQSKNKELKAGVPYEIFLLVFNYTATIDLYKKKIIPREIASINYIHGKLKTENNPIIFGYGDETDDYYSKIERLNSNEFLKNIKSFSYLLTNNYIKLSRFIDSRNFNVYIMGHSCGISDRVLLKSIFEHKNCQAIKIYYHLKNNGENDFFEKTQEISRHFSANSKDRMRKIIVPLTDCVPLT